MKDNLLPRNCVISFFSHRDFSCQDLHTFPTRRSSDLYIGPPPTARGLDQTLSVASPPLSDLILGVSPNLSDTNTTDSLFLSNFVCRLLLEKKKSKHKK